ncbi:MAG: hypothetical protein MJZ25_14700, partial [Fibrobacter sp.]|nr:hypothetical protein [Fibrobacter sp.]
DALGRAYKKVKSKIRYFIGKETKAKKTVEVAEELDVWKKVEEVDGKEVVSFRKFTEDGNIDIDSTLLDNDQFSVNEINLVLNYVRYRSENGEEFYDVYDENNVLINSFCVGLKEKDIYDENGELVLFFSKIHGDTAFLNLAYDEIFDVSIVDYQTSEKAVGLKKNSYDKTCPNLVEQSGLPKASCPRFRKESVEYYVKTNKNADKKYVPGLNGKPTFGTSHADSSDSFRCVKCGKLYNHVVENFLSNETINVFRSNWFYDENNKEWIEQCWSLQDMQKTYDHEAAHILNARKYVDRIINKYMLTERNEQITNNMSDWGACIREGDIQMDKVMKNYRSWWKREVMHKNPESPKASDSKRIPVLCD